MVEGCLSFLLDPLLYFFFWLLGGAFEPSLSGADVCLKSAILRLAAAISPAVGVSMVQAVHRSNRLSKLLLLRYGSGGVSLLVVLEAPWRLVVGDGL